MHRLKHLLVTLVIFFALGTIIFSLGNEASRRADPCEKDPPGNALGRDRHCPPQGSSSGIARGDFNGDGKVDQADYVVYRKTVGQDGINDTATTKALLLADADGDLKVGANDLRIWRENFGRTVGDGGLPVPEPGTMFLTLIGLASLSVFRKRAS